MDETLESPSHEDSGWFKPNVELMLDQEALIGCGPGCTARKALKAMIMAQERASRRNMSRRVYIYSFALSQLAWASFALIQGVRYDPFSRSVSAVLSHQTADVDFVVPQGGTKAARTLLRGLDQLFEIEKRTNHTYYKSTPPIEIEILTPPALFKQQFSPKTPVIQVNHVTVLKPTLLLNAKWDSILGRSSVDKRTTDAMDIGFLRNWCARNQMFPTTEEVPNASKEFVDYFVSLYGDKEAWPNAGWDFANGRWTPKP